MSDISKKNIETLKEKFYFPNLQIHKTFVDEEDDTTKFLFKLADGNLIEAVLMLFEFGNSICISSQIGCNMGCKFCASGLMKKIRNLEPYEYLLQYLKINDYLVKNKKMKVTNISFMGIGEPFDNYVNLSKAIKMLNDKNGINLGHRNMIVSTCGLIDKIVQFAYDFNQVKLAISLHASNDRTRSEIMPINKTYNLTKLFDAIEQ
jgi:23S rRNA (adenine2503-C2)-methyltransferase